MTQSADQDRSPSAVVPDPALPADDATRSFTHVEVALPPRLEGQQLGPYQIEEQIGRGAMGQVFRATHTRLKRHVAVKILPLDAKISPKQLARFHREMEAVGRMDHPNLVRATDAGEFDGIHYLAMELIDGQDVWQRIQRHGRLDVAVACAIVYQTALGLEHVRENGLVHRDIKPSNLLLTHDGVVKILDLGIAMLRHEDSETAATALGVLMGTPDYIAPEQVGSAAEVDIRADIYSLGCTLYTLLAGTPPFSDSSHSTHISKVIAHTNAKAPSLQGLRPELPTDVVAIVERMMEKDPAQRYQTPREVAEALQPFARDEALLEWCQRDAAGIESRSTRRGFERATPLTRDRRHDVWRSWPILVACAATIFVMAFMWQSEKSNAPWGTRQVSDDGLLEVAHHAQDTPDGVDGQTVTAGVNTSDGTTAATEALTSISGDAAQIRQNTEELSETSRTIADNTARIADALGGLSDRLAAAETNGGIIENPRSVSDHYVNALLHEKRHEMAEARESYLAILNAGHNYVDVHQRFQQLLRLHDGPSGAVTVYRGLAGDPQDPVRRLAMSWLEELPEREIQVQGIVESHPDFAPALYELSRCVSFDALGEQSLTDRVREKEYLKQFTAAVAQGTFLGYFLDQELAATMLRDAEARTRTLESLDETILSHPVDLSFSRYSRGWNVHVQVKETPREIFVKGVGSDEFASTGFTQHVDPRTQRPFPLTQWSLPLSTAAGNLEIAYTDVRGIRRGPYTFAFEPDAALLDDARRELQFRPDTWATFGRGSRTNRLYFNTLARFREVIDEVHYAFDQDEPTIPFELPRLEEANVEYSVEVPESARFVVVRVKFRDGSVSAVSRIER